MQNLAGSLAGKIVNEIVVLDFKEKDYTEQTKSLYDDNHLAIYINVDGENESNDAFFVKYTGLWNRASKMKVSHPMNGYIWNGN
jgi:hypothetical protein